MAQQRAELRVAQWLAQLHPLAPLECAQQSRLEQPRARARMQRNENRRRQRADQLHERAQALGGVDVARPVRREQQVLTRLKAARAHGVEVAPGVLRPAHGNVDHHVSHEHRPAREALGAQVLAGRLGRAQQQVAEVVGDHAVELLGHRAVVRAHARLDVHQRDVRQPGRERARERGVRVAVHECRIGAQLLQHGAERDQHARGLGRVGAAPEPQLAVRLREA